MGSSICTTPAINKYQFASGSSSPTSRRSSDDEDDLPYPRPLPRSSFLTPDFTPTSYLSIHAHNRHQTLGDLRTELRQRSQYLAAELLQLVNTDYHDYLSLGDSLRGGGEKVEEVKVGVLAFRGGVEEVREKVRTMKVEVGGLLGERRRIRKEIRLGRGLVELDRRLAELEGRLLLGSQPPGAKDSNPGGEEEEKSGSHTDDEESDPTSSSDTDSTASSPDHEPTPLTSPTHLHRLTTHYLSISHLLNRLDCSSHPFITSNIHPRLLRVKNTLLLDLASALKGARARKASGEKVVKILGVYRELGEGGEAVRVLKEAGKG
ncbi:MAG: hypothetical protein M1840_008968 [Geoglossum simile]|nr:MAG: hypothetical protein M1840_008968 [Geoglossum simile]